MKTALGVILASLFILPLATADCRVRVVSHEQAVVVNHAAVIATPIVQAVFLPVTVPAYSVTYGANDPALTQEIQQLRREIAALKAAPSITAHAKEQAKESVPPGDAVALFKTKCASCHDKATANKGGGFVLLENGQLSPINFKQALRVGTKTYRSEMPPNGKLTDDEVGTIQAWLDALK